MFWFIVIVTLAGLGAYAVVDTADNTGHCWL